jgi:hypothetical protein
MPAEREPFASGIAGCGIDCRVRVSNRYYWRMDAVLVRHSPRRIQKPAQGVSGFGYRGIRLEQYQELSLCKAFFLKRSTGRSLRE